MTTDRVPLSYRLKMFARQDNRARWKTVTRRISQVYRIPSHSIRMLPDFLIIGTQKGGTASLWDYLLQHPHVYRASRKETNYFNINYMKGTRWYRAQFPCKFWDRYSTLVHGHDIITGEATPDYIFHPHCAQRSRQTVPNVKIIVLLRNPVDRAYSNYQHEVRLGVENLSFEEAVACEEQRLLGERERILSDEGYNSFNYYHFTYLKRGVYVDQIKNWMDLFPREQILLIKSEDFFSDPQEAYNEVLRFLCLPHFVLKDVKIHNKADYSGMDSATRKFLAEYYKPHNRSLYEYLGVDYGWES